MIPALDKEKCCTVLVVLTDRLLLVSTIGNVIFSSWIFSPQGTGPDGTIPFRITFP
jgi:hypothetical protein